LRIEGQRNHLALVTRATTAKVLPRMAGMNIVAKFSTLSPPEPLLTPATIVARATALRPLLRERQTEAEASRNISLGTNRRLIDVGLYHTVQPRTFGGYEFTPMDFYRAMMEI
jgi:3-hydroxy-9,10-secoandrosta-1,3,5(10)-triene-9,17-dione monooxygenase